MNLISDGQDKTLDTIAWRDGVQETEKLFEKRNGGTKEEELDGSRSPGGAETPREPRGAGRGVAFEKRSAVEEEARRVGPACPPGQRGRCPRQHVASAGLEGDASFH